MNNLTPIIQFTQVNFHSKFLKTLGREGEPSPALTLNFSLYIETAYPILYRAPA